MCALLARSGVPVAEELTKQALPWWVGPYYKSDIMSRNGRVAETGIMRGEQGIADAAFIVRAVNAHADLLAVAEIIGSAYPNDPGTSDLDDEQAVAITLGTVRRAWRALAKVDGRVA